MANTSSPEQTRGRLAAMRSTTHSSPTVRRRRLLPIFVGWLVGSGCEVPPTPLPTEVELAERDRTADPPLYQVLYDTPVLPEQAPAAARVRQLVWLRHMQLSTTQLDRLADAHAVAMERLDRMKQREEALVAQWQEHEAGVYNQIWGRMSDGASVDAPEMNALVDELRELRAGGERERNLVSARLASLQAVLEAEQAFLRTLSPRQEQLMADALFFLRHRLDPIANPGDFRALVGSTYEPGQYAVLQRGLDEQLREPLDIGGLWQEADEPGGHIFFDAKREVLLLMAMLQPGFPEALTAARQLAEREASTAGPTPGAPPPP